MKKTNATTANTAPRRTRVTPAPERLTREQFVAEQTAGILFDLARTPEKTVSHAYGTESATSTFDAFGRVSRVKSSGYDAAARTHAESRKVGSILLQGVHRMINGKRVAPAQERLVTPDLVERVREALAGAAPTMANVADALRKVAAEV